MAKTVQISDGTLTVDLIDETSPGISLHSGGWQGANVVPHQFDQLGGLEDQLFADRFRLLVQGSSQDNIATQTRNLISLLRNAWRYHSESYATTPVYLQFQTTNETNARYALVYQCPEVTYPDFYEGTDFDSQDLVTELGVTIVRGIWRSGVPGTLPTALTLTASDGPASPTKVHVANFRDDVNVTDFKEDDGGVYSDYAVGNTLWPATPAQNDALLIGSTDQPLHTIVIPALGTAGSITTSTQNLYYWNGAWTLLTLGDNYTVYPGPDIEQSFEQNSDDIAISVVPPSDFAKTTIDGSNAFWYRIQEDNASPSYATRPVLHASNAIYAQSHPYLEVSNSVLKGDVPPLVNLRLHSPYGGDADEAFSNISRIIIGAKDVSGSSTFVSHLNAGGDDNPSGWATAQGTDATSTADVRAPAGKISDVTFATDTTLIKRVTFTGTAKLADWIGDYRAFLRAEQEGGTAGDVRVKLRVFIHESNDYSPKYETPVVPTQAADSGPELIELGDIKIPFGDVVDADGFTSADIIFEVHAEDTVGSADLEIFDLILIPTDEWAVDLDDPVTDSVNGTSALRGDTVLEVDGGVLRDRTIKYQKNGSNLYLAEFWGRGGPSPMLQPETQLRLYFVMAHYPTTYGQPPFTSIPGMHLAAQVYAHALYLILRGAD